MWGITTDQLSALWKASTRGTRQSQRSPNFYPCRYILFSTPWFIVIKTFGNTKLQSELYFWNKTQSLVLTQQEPTAWGTKQFGTVFSLLPACIMASSKMLGANGANRIKRCVLMWEKTALKLQPAVVYFAGCSCGFCQTFAGMKFGGPASGSNNQQSIKNQSSFYCCKLVSLTFLFSNSCL